MEPDGGVGTMTGDAALYTTILPKAESVGARQGDSYMGNHPKSLIWRRGRRNPMRLAKVDSKASRMKIHNRSGGEEEKKTETKKRKTDTVAGETNDVVKRTDKPVRKVDSATSD
jgi:hypothetical protein